MTGPFPACLETIAMPGWMTKLLTFPLEFISPSTTVRILFGPLRGKKWIAGSSRKSCWIGTYELQKARKFKALLQEGFTVFDIGAHVGYYTLLASKGVEKSGRVFAFEPSPRNARFLNEHLRLNEIQNATLLKIALSNTSGLRSWDPGPTTLEGHLAPHGAEHVTTRTLDELVLANEISLPHVIKLDVEGAEFDVLSGAERTLKKNKPIIFLSIDKPHLHKPCTEFLVSMGYTLESLNAPTVHRASEILARYLP